MTRDEAKKLLPVIQAFADGKDVQVKQLDGSWYDISNPGFGVGAENYRIKPEPLECWVLKDSNGVMVDACISLKDVKKSFDLFAEVNPPYTIHHMREVI